jgi:hypothetical protein
MNEPLFIQMKLGALIFIVIGFIIGLVIFGLLSCLMPDLKEWYWNHIEDPYKKGQCGTCKYYQEDFGIQHCNKGITIKRIKHCQFWNYKHENTNLNTGLETT